jgi:hypothetical protein
MLRSSVVGHGSGQRPPVLEGSKRTNRKVMTTKEKAIELVARFKLKHKFFTNSFIKTTAKECALIAVDEIMNVIIGSYDYELEKIYWQDVKQEIEKL